MASSKRIKAVAGGLAASLCLFLLTSQSSAILPSSTPGLTVDTLHSVQRTVHVQLKDGTYSDTITVESTATTSSKE